MSALLDRADLVLGRLIGFARWLVLPVALLLFLQWPLRELLRAGSREANDLGQWLFALFVAFAFTYASRSGTHLGAGGFAERIPVAWRNRLALAGTALLVLPWALFMLVASLPTMWQSMRQLEQFSETGNPGYWLIKLAVGLLALLVLLQGLLDIARHGRGHED